MYEIKVSRTRSKSGKHWKYYATKGIENHNEHHSFSPSGIEDYVATLPEDTALINNGVGWWQFRKLKKALGTNETIDECVDGTNCGETDGPTDYASRNLVEHVYQACKSGDLTEVLSDFWILQEAGWVDTIVEDLYAGILKYYNENQGGEDEQTNNFNSGPSTD